MNVLSGKVALVTGSGRGIGREIALRLAKDGASIVAHYSGSKSGADAVVSEIEGSGGRAIACQADISKRDQVARMFEAIDREFGSLDIVVNNAGAMTIAQPKRVRQVMTNLLVSRSAGVKSGCAPQCVLVDCSIDHQT